MFSYALFVFACLIPPSVYTRYMHEPDLMFLDPATILFYTLCVAAFLAGVWFLLKLFPPVPSVERKFETRISPTVFLMVPLTIGIVVTIALLFFLVERNPEILVFLLAQQGSDLKEAVEFEIQGNLNLAPLMLTGIIWWAFWRWHDLGIQGWRNRLVKSTLVIAVLSVVATATLLLSRDLLILVLCGLAIMYIARRSVNDQVSFRFVLGTGTAIALCVALLFLSFSFLRGSDSLDDLVCQLLGYTVASYNRLAAIVDGHLRYPFADRGFYLSGFFAFNHTLNRLVPITRLMDWPDHLDDWGAQFGAVTRAGLDGRFIWSGAFGYIFSDLGWFSLPFLFGYGMLYGVVWNWIRRGNVLGVVLYPCVGFCVLFWVGSNYLLDSQPVILLVVAIMLGAYESLCASRIKVLRPLLPVSPVG